MQQNSTIGKNARIWLRVSSSEQSVEPQRTELTELADRRGWTVSGTYELIGSACRSAAAHTRQLAELEADASHGQLEILIVWALDRLERRGAVATVQLLDLLAARGVRVVSHREPWVERTADPAVRQLMTYLAGWMAECESRRRSDRVKAGLRNTKKKSGRPRVRLSNKRAREAVDEYGGIRPAAAALGVNRGVIERRIR